MFFLVITVWLKYQIPTKYPKVIDFNPYKMNFFVLVYDKYKYFCFGPCFFYYRYLHAELANKLVTH